MRPLHRSPRRDCGFTVVELLVVLAIVAISLAMALPAIQAAREASRLEVCQNNLKLLGLALHSYRETHDRFPYTTTCSTYGPTNPNTGHTWNEFLLPYMDMSAVYLKLDFNTPNTAPANARVLERLKLPWQSCPSNEYSDKMHDIKGNPFQPWKVPMQGQFYAACTGTQWGDGNGGFDCMALGLGIDAYCCTKGSNWDVATPSANPGMFRGRNPFSATLQDVTDGTSTTFLLGERRAETIGSAAAFSVNFPGAPTIMKLNSKLLNPNDVQDYGHNWGFSSRHEGGGNFLFVDGKVRFINDAINYETYCRLSDKADGNKVSDLNGTAACGA